MIHRTTWRLLIVNEARKLVRVLWLQNDAKLNGCAGRGRLAREGEDGIGDCDPWRE